MSISSRSGICGRRWRTTLQAGLALALSMVLVEQPVLAELASRKSKDITGAKELGQLAGEQRILHALNRLTFGPRPGDVAAVQAMGLQRWFAQQLNPTAIDDSALEARLAMFPAMQLNQAELMQRYPSPQLLRQMIMTKSPLPSDPLEQRIYADQMAFYQAARAKQAAENANSGEAKQKAAGADAAMEMGKAALPGDGVDPSVPAMATHEEQLYSGLEAVKIINLPANERFQRVMSMPPEELMNFRKSLSRVELGAAMEGLTPEQREIFVSLQGSARMIGAEVVQSRLLRDIYSDRQLEAVMTDFWLNHFNVYLRKNGNEPYFLPAFERDVVRPHALGKFEDLLVATAQSPAMLMYLDNWQSIGPDSQAARNAGRKGQFAQNPQAKQSLKDRGLNENYARELMELHTLGVQCEVSEDHPVQALPRSCGTGYTQSDVTAVAKVLTGWTIDRPLRGGEYRFDERRHEPGSKTVLHTTIREGGQMEGLQVLHMLASSPATAQFICSKLAVRFVSDTPPQALVDRMAASFVSSGGDIKTVLRTMFDSPEFWSPEVYRAKVKTPLEFVASAVRASNAEVGNGIPLVQSLDRLGMPMYGMQTPNGYSWMAEPWVSTGELVNRMNFALVLSSNHLPGVRTDWTRLLETSGRRTDSSVPTATLTSSEGSGAGGEPPSTLAEVKEEKLAGVLLGGAVSDHTRQTVLREFSDQRAQLQAQQQFSIKMSDPDMMANALPGGTMANQEDRPKAAPVDQQTAAMAGLLLGSPEFQRR